MKRSWRIAHRFFLSPSSSTTALLEDVGLPARVLDDLRQLLGIIRSKYGDCSRLTFMIYLNEGFDGGDTRFYLNHNYLELFDPNVVPDVSVVPTTGMALCFCHELRHEGTRMIRGRKYVLRSDVM